MVCKVRICNVTRSPQASLDTAYGGAGGNPRLKTREATTLPALEWKSCGCYKAKRGFICLLAGQTSPLGGELLKAAHPTSKICLNFVSLNNTTGAWCGLVYAMCALCGVYCSPVTPAFNPKSKIFYSLIK